ncbi:MAG: arginine--tRNA ligase [Candidatus Wildermuthbacteria bacterium]|nr:arginine--tRNA ligase [Candidatus Wildermuthbacteria bacterium]
MKIQEELRKFILGSLQKHEFFVDAPVVFEHPENAEHGDYSTNIALVLAKKLGKNPREVAESIVKATSYKLQATNFVEKVEVAGPGFINFFLSKEYLIKELDEIVKQKEQYGAGSEKKKIIVEYSSPNIAKPFGIGHLRSTIIGQAIYNLYKFLGYKTIGINYPGDWGTPHGKILYQLYKDLELKGKSLKDQRRMLQDLTVAHLEFFYVEFNKDAALNPSLEEEARNWFKKLEQGDKEARMIWEQTRVISLKEFDRIYDLLDVKIDNIIGESFFEDKMEEVVQDFKKKGLAQESQGALIVSFPNDVLPPAMLLKSDGATTYFTRDLANMKYRITKWKPNSIVIETGVEQVLHFQQVFLASKLVGYAKDEELVHVSHGLYRTKEGKFSTRKGQTIHLEGVLKEAVDKAREIIEQSETTRGLSEQEKIEVAKAVGIGGIKYNDLSQHPSGDIVFDWGKILNLKGNSAPYLQYTYARCKSILRKAQGSGTSNLPRASFKLALGKLSQEEVTLLRLLYRFGEVVQEAAEKFSPNLVCSFVFDLAQRYNLFYNTNPVLKAESEEVKNFRLLLTASVAQVIKNGLSLLGIAAPEKM